MPPKAKFTREEIISAALELTREKGIEAVTARNLGERLNSSARPIFTVFESMEEVISEVICAAKVLYTEYIHEGLKEKLAFRGVGMAYIRFAIQESRLFQLLFMRAQKEEPELKSVLTAIEDNYELIVQSVMKPHALTREEAVRLYQELWIFSHGIATLCATGMCRFTQEEITDMLTDVFLGLIRKIDEKRERSSNDQSRKH